MSGMKPSVSSLAQYVSPSVNNHNPSRPMVCGEPEADGPLSDPELGGEPSRTHQAARSNSTRHESAPSYVSVYGTGGDSAGVLPILPPRLAIRRAGLPAFLAVTALGENVW